MNAMVKNGEADCSPQVRPMTIEDYDQVYALWNASLASVRDIDDSREKIDAFLRRNPGTSVVAEVEGKITGSILCGNDGRRGYLYHVAVDAAQRRGGVAKAMLATCLNALRAQGIRKCALLAFTDNTAGNAFWEATGFHTREDIYYRDCWLTPPASPAGDAPPSEDGGYQ